MCLPFLRWLHRFNRPNGTEYSNNLEDRFRNYYIGFLELGLGVTDLKKEFKDVISEEFIKKLEKELDIS